MDQNKVAQREEKRIKLDLLHAFGSLGHMEFKDGVVFIDDGKIKLGYPVGKYLASRAIDKPETSFLKLNDNLDRVMSLCISKNRRTLAIGQKIKGDNFPQVAIYQVRSGPNREREKIFRYTETKSDAFVHMAFGEDSRFLALLTGHADCQLIFLDTSRMRAMATAILGIGATRVSISPKDNHIIAITGDKMLKILRVHETSFKSLGDVTNLNLNQKFTDHAWAGEQKLIVCNDNDTVYVIYQTQVIQTINNCFGLGEGDFSTSATALTVFSRGFIIGSDNGTLAVWTHDERDDSITDRFRYNYLRTKKAPLIKNQEFAKRKAIVSMDVSPSQDLLAICFKNNDIATVSISQLAPTFEENTDSFKIKKFLERDIPLNYLYNGFHNGSITCLDVCTQRPIIATCSTYDSTIRLWNYSQNKSELVIPFNKPEDIRGESTPVLSLALHPSGYYMAVGFSDRLELFHICSEELRSFRRLPVKNVTCLKFSKGGHMLAAAYPRPNQSHYHINVYNSYTLELLTPYALKGPGNTVTDLLWTRRDESIVSCALDGSLFEWKIQLNDESQRGEFPENMAKFTSLAYTYNGMILACGSETGNGIVKEVKSKESYEKVHKIPWGKLAQIMSFRAFYNTPSIIGGTPNGAIKIFPEIFSVEAYDSLSAHIDEINKIVASPDGRYIFTVGKDHCILVFQVTEVFESGSLVSRTGGEEINASALAVDDALANFVLLSRNEIERFRTEIKQLKIEVEDLNDKILITAEEDRKKMEEDQANAEDVMRTNVKKWEDSYSELQKQKNQLEKEYANLLKVMESNHMKAVEELENLYEKKLSYENDKYVQKEQELNNLRNDDLDHLEGLNKHHEETIDKLEKQYRDEFAKTQRIFETNKNTAAQIKMEYEEKLNEIEEEHETEIKDLKMKQKKEIDDKKTDIARLRHENERFRRDQKDSKEEKVNLLKSEEEKTSEIKQLKSELNEANDNIENLKKEIENEEERINRKNKKIYDYKSKISDLQKSKHVLSYRTAEMRKSLEPKEAQIEKLKDELFKLEKEFEGMLKTGQVQNEKLVEKEEKIEELSKVLKANTALCNKKENLIQKIIMDIYQSVKNKEPKELGNELRRLFKEYCTDVELKQEHHDPRSVEEMVRQVQHLEKSITQMGRSTEKMVKRRETDIYRKTMENSDLICDLNDLRKANKKLESDIYNLTKNNENLTKEQRNIAEDIAKLKSTLGKLRKDVPEASQTGNQFPPVSEQRQTTKMPPLYKPKPDSANVQKGKLIKGSMFDMKAQSINDRNKLVEIMAEIEMANRRIMQQDAQLARMRAKVATIQPEQRDKLRSQDGNRTFSQSSLTGFANSRKNFRPHDMKSDDFTRESPEKLEEADIEAEEL